MWSESRTLRHCAEFKLIATAVMEFSFELITDEYEQIVAWVLQKHPVFQNHLKKLVRLLVECQSIV